jgi:membrane protein YqaA with SNARE-associated domain
MKLPKDNYVKDLISGLLIIVGIYALGLIFGSQILNALIKVPFFNQVYKSITVEIARRSVLGLSFLTFLGGLFFVPYPAELLFLIYTRIGYNIIYVAVIMVLFTMLAQAANYGIGFFIEEKILHDFVKEKKREFLSSLKKYDIMFIVILNILPLPADILSVIFGMIRYDFKKAMFYTFIGKVLKYLFLGVIVWLISLSRIKAIP